MLLNFLKFKSCLSEIGRKRRCTGGDRTFPVAGACVTGDEMRSPANAQRNIHERAFGDCFPAVQNGIFALLSYNGRPESWTRAMNTLESLLSIDTHLQIPNLHALHATRFCRSVASSRAGVLQSRLLVYCTSMPLKLFLVMCDSRYGLHGPSHMTSTEKLHCLALTWACQQGSAAMCQESWWAICS